MNSLETINSDISESSSDILSLLEHEETIIETPVISLSSETPEDPLMTLLAMEDAPATETPSILQSASEKVAIAGKFLLHYLGVSAAVFAVLLIATNYHSYLAILENLLNPDALKASSTEILQNLDKTKITAYANPDESDEKDLNAAQIKEKLDASNISVKEDVFSPEGLISKKATINVDFDLTPYDNRIIIPKLGKNIPLVDVDGRSGFDFDHIENIFMKELEKGVVRYPGTAHPGENGNAFVFGHSSNYPWVKGEYNSVFALLDNLSFGDEIIVYYNQKKYTYIIREKKIVKPGDVKVLERDENKKELSLMTCWPVGTTLNRMIVFSELKEITTP